MNIRSCAIEAPALTIYGTKDFALDDSERVRLIQEDSIKGNGLKFKVLGEGHVIARKLNVNALLARIVNFIDQMF